jgi:hypothetical protein
MSNDPDVFAEPADAGTVNRSDPPPEADCVESMAGVVSPGMILGIPGAAFP